MSDTRQETGGTRTWDFASQIDEVCDLFEAAWKAGERPRIEDYLNDTPVPARAALLRELIPLDMEYRERAGETVSEEDYRTRFPSWSPEDSALGPGSTVPLKAGRYLLGDKIGEGGMGEVYRVKDPDFNRSLAVKVLKKELRGRPDLEARFLEEAQILGQLQYPGIVPVHELGRLDDGRPFFAMKLVKGQTLEQLLQQRPRPVHDLPRFLAIFEQICQTMANAHAHGVIHRDLKPRNVMVGAFGEVQVMDWGLAKVLAEPASGGPKPAEEGASVLETVRTKERGQVSQPGAVLGTYAYMPPEQARGEVDRLDKRCDVFGLGAILCVILTGQPPYTGRSVEDLKRKAQTCDLTDAEARLAQCGADGELVELTRKCLAPDREERPRDAAAVAQAVTTHRAAVQERLREAELAAARAATKAAEERKRRRLAVGLAAAVLMALLIGGISAGWLVWQRQLTRHDVEPLLADVEDILAHSEKDRGVAEHLLEQAQSRMAGGGPSDLRTRLIVLERNLDMAKRLEKASNRATSVAEGKLDFRGGDRAYAAAFADFGLDISDASVEEVADAIRGSAIADRLITALDHWAYCKDQIAPQGGADLRSFADSVDNDPWRRRLRSAMRTSNLPELEQLVRDESSLDQPATNLMLLGLALRRSNQSAAEGWLRKANERHPNDFSINILLASTLRTKVPADLGEAIRFLQAALALQPDNATAHTERGATWAQMKDYGRAISDYDEAIRLDPTFAPAFYNRGNAWDQKNDYDRAICDFDEAIRIDPNYAQAFNNRGVVWHERKDYDRAIGDYDEAIRLDFKLARAFNNRGIAWGEKNNYDRAICDFDEAIALDPTYAKAFFNRGNAWHAKKVYDRAIKDYGEAIRFNFIDATVFTNRGIAWYDKKDYDRAIGDFDEAIHLDPNHAPAFYNRGNAWYDKKDYDAAIRDYEKAISLNRYHAKAFNNRGNAWREKRDYDRAIGDYDEAIRLDRKYGAAFVNRGNAWLGKKDFDRAISDYDAAIKLDPECAPAFNNRGHAFGLLNQLERAEADFHKAVELSPNYVEAWAGLGFCLNDQGRFAEARGAFQKSLALAPEGSAIQKAVAQNLQVSERLIVLDKQLSNVLNGEDRPGGPIERLQLAKLCQQYRKRYAAAARFYAEAFEAQPELAKDAKVGHRYNAACSAALAGSGQGKDADTLDDKDRPRLRKKALDWLRADFALWTKQAESQKAEDRMMVVQILNHWREDADLAGVREKTALEKLPDTERAEWEKLWADVSDLLKKVQEQK
jgi:serine/threonine-protein kinase